MKKILQFMIISTLLFTMRAEAECIYGIPSPSLSINAAWRNDAVRDIRTSYDTCYGVYTKVTFATGDYLPMSGRFDINTRLYESDPPGDDDVGLYYVGISEILFVEEEDGYRFELVVEKEIDDEWQDKDVNPGTTVEDLKKQDSVKGYLWTVNEIVSRKLFWIDFKSHLYVFTLIFIIDVILILISKVIKKLFFRHTSKKKA